MITLYFAHAENGASTASMAIGDAPLGQFDYVDFVKHLFANPEENLRVQIEDSYSEEQKNKLQNMIEKIESAAKAKQSNINELKSK